MENYYNRESIKKLASQREKLNDKIELLTRSFPTAISSNDSHDNPSYEYLYHGYCRRIMLIQTCINNIYEMCPIDHTICGGHKDENLIDNITINLQAVIINVAGCLDNLVRFYVDQKKCNDFKKDGDYTFFGKKFKGCVSAELRGYIKSLDDKWNKPYFKKYRDSLAHRIPLYIPLRCFDQKEYSDIADNAPPQPKDGDYKAIIAHTSYLNKTREASGHFRPIMKGTFNDSTSPINFHKSILDDCEIVVNVGEKVFDELGLFRKKYDESIFSDNYVAT